MEDKDTLTLILLWLLQRHHSGSVTPQYSTDCSLELTSEYSEWDKRNKRREHAPPMHGKGAVPWLGNRKGQELQIGEKSRDHMSIGKCEIFPQSVIMPLDYHRVPHKASVNLYQTRYLLHHLVCGSGFLDLLH